MTLIWTVIIGFFVGLVARFLKPGRDNMGFILTTLLGIGGAVLGAVLGRATGMYGADEPAGFIAATIGAILLLLAISAFSGRRRII